MGDDQDEDELNRASLNDTKTFLLLYRFAYPFRYAILFALMLMFVSSGAAIYSSKLMGDFVEKGLVPLHLGPSVKYASWILLLEALSILFIWLSRRKMAALSSLILLAIRHELFLKLQKLPMSYFDRCPQGRTITRMTSDVEGIEDFFTSSLSNLVSAVITTLLAIVAMLITHFKLGAMMTAGIFICLIPIILTKDLLKKSNRRVSKYSSAINARLSEYLSGLEVIRILGIEAFTMKKYDEAIDDYLQAQLKGNFLFAWNMPVLILFVTLPLIGLVWFGGKAVLMGTLGLGIFISFIRYFERFYGPLLILSREIHVVQQAFTSTERVMSFLIEKDEDDYYFHKTSSLDYIKGKIEFKNVSMGYTDDQYILKNLNFCINPGEKIGLVGKTGCGKSSTVSLLLRLYEFQEGDILIDDISIRNIDRHFIRSQIGFVSQETTIFRGTLRDNLMTKNVLSDDLILFACKETGLYQALRHFNLDEEILDAGLNLSVGERQLLGLTRVLLSNPSILILDEATANIDPHFEEIIQRAIMKIMQDRTCLMIAHRLDTLKSCDRLLHFDDGRLVEE